MKMNIDSYKISTFGIIEKAICCATCKYGRKNTGEECIMNSNKCLGRPIAGEYKYNYWKPVNILPEELFEI